jgi:hypothetical protein
VRKLARFFAYFAAVVAIGALFVLGGSASADHDPGDPDVHILAVDTDTRSNTATHIETIDPCASLPGTGSTISVDIAVDQVPDAGASGIGIDVLYDPAVLHVTGLNFNQLLASGGSFNPITSSDSFPDSDGDFRFDVLDISGINESGEGVLARVTFQAVGNGTSAINLDDFLIGDGVPDILDPDGNTYNIHTLEGGSINVGAACAPSTDLSASAPTISAPASGAVGAAFNVTAGGTVQNNGPVASVNADARVSLGLPSDCTAAGGNQHIVQDVTLASGSPVVVPTQTFSVTCTSPSFHSISSSISVALDDASATETSLGNNAASSSPATTAVTGVADLQITGVTVSAAAAATPTPMAGISFTVTGAVAVKNNGPYGPADVTMTATLSVPSDCIIPNSSHNPQPVFGNVASGATSTINASWVIMCRKPGAHTFSVAATVAPSALHVADAPGNNNGSGNTSATLKVASCGDDPNPAGDPIQNISPQLLLLIQSLTATGTPVSDALKYQIDCNFDFQTRDSLNTPVNECPVNLVNELPCSLRFNLSLDVPGGSPADDPTIRLNPVGVTFLPMDYDWANDTEIPNGSKSGSADFSIRTDGGGFPLLGLECVIKPIFPTAIGYEGGIQGNVPDSNNSADLTNPNVWPNDLNAERALVEQSFSAPLPVPLPGNPIPSGVTLWSRTVLTLNASGTVISLNILTWKITNPLFQALTGAGWVVVPFPSDALNPDPAGAVGGNPDADDPPSDPNLNYCGPHSVGMQFNGKIGNVAFISCHVPGSKMAWNLVDPDALNVSGDEGPRSDVANCSLDTDQDGLSAAAEAYYGSNPSNMDTDGDTFKDPNEAMMGTDPAVACAATPIANDEDTDSLPVDFNDNQLINGQDVAKYGVAYNKTVPNVTNGPRYDMNGDGIINGQDVARFAPFYNTHC